MQGQYFPIEDLTLIFLHIELSTNNEKDVMIWLI